MTGVDNVTYVDLFIYCVKGGKAHIMQAGGGQLKSMLSEVSVIKNDVIKGKCVFRKCLIGKHNLRID